MDAETAVIIGAAAAVVIIAEDDEVLFRERMRRKHRYWTRSWFEERKNESQRNTMYKLQQELLEVGDVDEFRVTLRMPPDIYASLLEKVRPYITKADTNFRKAISAEERLSMTMRYLALGESYRTLRQGYRVGLSTVGRVLRDTADGLYEALKDEYLVTLSSTDEWLKVAAGFENRWNFPHTLGALDGKHIRIQSPPASGSLFYNYKQYFSIILMALVNSEYEFIFVDIGSEGRASDGGVWKKTSLFALSSDAENPLNIPEASPVPGVDGGPLPYYFIGDDAFALAPNFMKPHPKIGLSQVQRIYNYRFSRARMTVENAFGILSTRFRVYRREMEMRPEGAEKMVMATIVLHNMMCRECPTYMRKSSVDHEIEGHKKVNGLWRQEPPLDTIDTSRIRNYPRYAKEMRNRLTRFVVSDEGEVPWQYDQDLWG